MSHANNCTVFVIVKFKQGVCMFFELCYIFYSNELPC